MNRSRAVGYVGVGSNIRPEENVSKGLGLLVDTPGINVTGISTFYRTAPLADPSGSIVQIPEESEAPDPDFLNGVLALRTFLSTTELLNRLTEIEGTLGRERPSKRFAPRTMDLDLLLFGLDEGAGTNPQWMEIGPAGIFSHSDIQRRGFVALPLLELAPDLVLPPYSIPLRAMALSFDTPGGKAETSFTAELRARFLP